MPSSLVMSQFDALEPLDPDERGMAIDVGQSVDAIVETFVRYLPIGSDLDHLGAAGQLVVLALLAGAGADRHGDDDVGDERQQRTEVRHHCQQCERVADRRLGEVRPGPAARAEDTSSPAAACPGWRLGSLRAARSSRTSERRRIGRSPRTSSRAKRNSDSTNTTMFTKMPSISRAKNRASTRRVGHTAAAVNPPADNCTGESGSKSADVMRWAPSAVDANLACRTSASIVTAPVRPAASLDPSPMSQFAAAFASRVGQLAATLVGSFAEFSASFAGDVGQFAAALAGYLAQSLPRSRAMSAHSLPRSRAMSAHSLPRSKAFSPSSAPRSRAVSANSAPRSRTVSASCVAALARLRPSSRRACFA